MRCLICKSQTVEAQLNVGDHPVSSFFLAERSVAERRFRLALGQCDRCGTVQSTNIVPYAALIPPYDWLFAREPEAHLDAVVQQIIALPGVHPGCVVGGLTYKDDTTVERFRKRGFSNTWRVRLDEDLGVTDPAANIETVQKLTNPERMAAIAERRGAADILIVRHILEHAEDVQAFIRGVAALLKPGGIVMVEVPDCTTSLKLHDYCMVWEEHSLYLTPASFEPLTAMGGFEPIRTDIFPIPFENSMVQLARKVAGPEPARINPKAVAEADLVASYCADLEPTRRAIRETLTRIREERGGIALFGAGHLACAFVNFLDVADLIDFVADDTPQKQHKFLPGARLPILPSAALVERGTALCLLALSIGNEDAVIAKNQAFVDAGGTFRSIFRASGRSIFAEDA